MSLEDHRRLLDVTKALPEGIRILRRGCRQVPHQIAHEKLVDRVRDVADQTALAVDGDGHAHDALQELLPI